MNEQSPESLSMRELAGPIVAFATPLLLCFVIVLAFDSSLILLSLDFVLLIVLGAWAVHRVKALERARESQPEP